MAGRRKDFDGSYAVIEVGFILDDPRMDIPSSAFRVYITLWTLAVKERRVTLPAHYFPVKKDGDPNEISGHVASTLARLSREDTRTIPQAISILLQKCLIKLSPNGEITVCGVNRKHPNFKWKECEINEFIDPHNTTQKNKNKKEEKDKKAGGPDHDTMDVENPKAESASLDFNKNSDSRYDTPPPPPDKPEAPDLPPDPPKKEIAMSESDRLVVKAVRLKIEKRLGQISDEDVFYLLRGQNGYEVFGSAARITFAVDHIKPPVDKPVAILKAFLKSPNNYLNDDQYDDWKRLRGS